MNAPPATGPSAWLRAAMEAVVLLLVVALPWGFSAVAPWFERGLFSAAALLLVLWAGRMVVEGRAIWAHCPVTAALAGLFLLGAWQLVPLSPTVLAAVSPGTAELTAALVPPSPTGWLSAGSVISITPGATRTHLGYLLVVAAVYAAVRSNVASEGSFRRLAWAGLASGFAVSLVGLFQFFSSPRDTILWTFRSEVQVFGPMNRNDFAGYTNLCIGLGVGLVMARRAGKRRLADDPLTVWVGAAVVLMMAALAVCLSRGGLICLLLAVGLVAVLPLGGRGAAVPAALAAVALLVAAWLGLGEAHGRLAQIGQDEDRWRVWAQTVPSAATFPVWGSGFGSFPFLEQFSRRTHGGIDYFYDHAHNDYLELLLEGGAVGLLIGLAGVIAAVAMAVRACRRHRGRPAGGLALGGTVALFTIVLHSSVDYGLHLPAIAVVTAVIVAHLAALTDDAPPGGGWAGAVVGVAAALGLAWALMAEGQGRELAERHKRAGDPSAMVAAAPHRADGHEALGNALLEAGRTNEAAAAYATARRLAPGLRRPHIGLAAAEPDRAAVHLERVRRVIPFHPTGWFLSGVKELQDSQPDRAWAHWRRSLECGPDHLDEILKRARPHLSAEEVVSAVLPADAELLMEAARRLDPDGQQAAFERAADVLGADATGERLVMRARALAGLGRDAEAAEAFGRYTGRGVWRYEYARVLANRRRFADAQQELRALLQHEPDHAPARDLLQAVARSLAEGE